MINSDDILDDEWDEDVFQELLKVEVALSAKPKTLSTNHSSSSSSSSSTSTSTSTSSSSISLQQQQQHQPLISNVFVDFSPPRVLSQRPTHFDSSPPKPSNSDYKDFETHRFKQEQRESGCASKQNTNLEKECLPLKNERDKDENQPKFVSSENEEDNGRTKRSKTIDNGRDFGIRAPEHRKASLKFQIGVSSNDPTANGVETEIVNHQEAQANGVETEIVNHQEAQGPPTPSGDLSAYLDLSQKLLAVWGSPSDKVLRSDVISKLFAGCQKDLRILYGCMSSSPPSEITRKLLTDVSSSRVSLHFVNDCFITPEAAKVSHLYHVLTKIADGTGLLETLIPPLLDICSMENVVIVHSSLCILHTLLKLLLELEKNFGRRDNVFIEGICIGKDLLDSDGLDGVKDGKPFNEEMLNRKECWNYQSALQPHVNWSNIFDIMHQISTRITEENVRMEAMSIMILLFLRSSAYFEREQFCQNTVFKTISELLKKDAGLRVKKKTLRLLYLVLNCPKLLATFCRGCKEGDSSSAMDNNASALDFQIFKFILQGLADCVVSHGSGLLELKISRKAILVLAFLASSGQPGFEIFIGHRLLARGVNYLLSILQLLVSEMDFEDGAHNEQPEVFRERTFLMREILILLNRLVSSPSYSAYVLHFLTSTRDMASLTIDVATRLSRKGNENERQDSMVKQIRRTEIIDLARLFKKRVLT